MASYTSSNTVERLDKAAPAGQKCPEWAAPKSDPK